MLSRVTQSDYASDLLYILAIYFSKLSAVFLFLRLTPNKQHVRFCYSILGTSTVWVVAAIFMVAIRCQLSQPWVNDQHCVNIVRDLPAICDTHLTNGCLVFAMANHRRLRHPHGSCSFCHGHLSCSGSTNYASLQSLCRFSLCIPNTVSRRQSRA